MALKAHLKDSSMWDGAVLVAPMCKIAEAMYPPWYLVQIMIALAHVIPKAKLVPHTDIAAIGFRDEEKRHKVSNQVYAPFTYCTASYLKIAMFVFLELGWGGVKAAQKWMLCMQNLGL